MNLLICCFTVLLSCSLAVGQNSVQSWKDLAPPETNGIWLQPAMEQPARPVWGHVNGIQIGLAPMPGPRGLLRVYTPYLGHPEPVMMNFIAIEPVPSGTEARGLSELEMSQLDGVRGKRFWSANDSLATSPGEAESPARGVISGPEGNQELSVYVFSESFQNGAKVYLRLRFYEQRPYEVEISVSKQVGSVSLDHCIVTATMGNYARLRSLYLEERSESANSLWPDYDQTDFAPHAVFSLKDMIRDKKGGAWFIAAPDEKDPVNVQYAPGTNEHWKYQGAVATQYWYCKQLDPRLQGLVNGRIVYWASKSPIPGGIAFENFEMKEPFRNGATFVFGVSPSKPVMLIKELAKK